MGLPSGSLLLAGGTTSDGFQSTIWLLEDDAWKEIGHLRQVNIENIENEYCI